MPNHVTSRMIVTGPKALREQFAQAAIDPVDPTKHLSCEAFFPYPKKYSIMDRAKRDGEEQLVTMEDGPEKEQLRERVEHMRDGYNQGGYEWCVRAWGTKWGFYDIKRSESARTLRYNFTTAWSPATPVHIEMSRRFPELKFRVFVSDEGQGFEGTMILKNGAIISNKIMEPSRQR